MKVKFLCLVAALLVVSIATASAATITINATDAGWYRDDGRNGGSGTAGSYAAGGSGNVFRNWFVFDVSGITNITGATLHLFDPSYLGFPGTNLEQPFQISSVSTPVSTLRSTETSVDIFNELGAGTPFGSALVSPANPDTYVDLVFNSAGLAALNSADGEIPFGGRVTTSENWLAFAFSGIFREPDWVQLVVEGTLLVPEPATALIFGGGLAFFGFQRRRRRAPTGCTV